MPDKIIVNNILKAFAPTMKSLASEAFQELEENFHVTLKTAYKTYLDKTIEKYSKSKTIFMQDKPSALYDFYVPIGIQCQEENIDSPSFKNCSQISKRMAIIGTGGSGKSVLLKHLFLDCLINKSQVPIFVELRYIEDPEFDLLDVIKETLKNFGFYPNGKYFEKALAAEHFAFFLDGYDEVPHKHRKRLVRQLKQMSDRVGDSPIFITSRPDDDLISLPDFDNYKIQNLSLEKALTLVQKLPADPTVKKKFKKDLKEKLYAKHKELLSNPLLLSIMLLTYSQNAEIPTKINIFYNQAYEALFQRHDASKGAFTRTRLTNLDIQEFEKVFGLFCLLTYDKHQFSFTKTQCLETLNTCRKQLEEKFETESFLKDCLDAVCLLIEDGLEVTFSHRSFQEYFVAKYTSQLPSETRKKVLKKLTKNSTFDRVIHLAFEINQSIVETELLIPELEKLFNNIGVKTKLGKTHHLKYIQISYEEFTVSDGKIGLFPKQTKNDFKNIVQLANKLYDKKEIPHKINFQDLCSQYSDNGNEKVYKCADFNYRTPLFIKIKDTFPSTSFQYLKNAHDVYLEAKKRIENKSESLEKILGIE